MAGPINLGGNAAAEFAASIATATAAADKADSVNEGQPGAGRPETAGSDGAPEETPEGDGDEDSEELVQPSDETPSGAGDDDSEGDEDDGGPGPAGAADRNVVAKELGQLLIDDPKEFFKLTGVDPKVLKLNGPKFESMRKGLKEVREGKVLIETRTKELDGYKAKVDGILEDGRKQYGGFVDLKNALGLDDFSAAQDILTRLDPKKRDFKTIAQGIVEAARHTSPAEATYKAKLREMAEKERKDAEAAAAAKQSEASATAAKALEQKNLTGAQAKLKGTDFEGIPKADETLVRIISENWDTERKGLKLAWPAIMKLMEADPVMALGLENKALKKGKAPKVETPVAVQKRGDRTPPSRKGAKADADAELRASMAEATRLEQAANRRASAGKGRR